MSSSMSPSPSRPGGLGTIFDDAGCTNADAGLTIPTGSASGSIYLQPSQAGPMVLEAADVADTLTQSTLSLSIDAVLLADQDFSALATVFSNNAWYTVESATGVAMQAQVTVPVSGEWYIEVHARATLQEGVNTATMARLLETGPAASVIADYDMVNLVDLAVASVRMAYVNPAPENGMTYTYTVQLSGANGNSSAVNPALFAFGPIGDQISDSQSMVMAVVRSARVEVVE